MYLNLSIERKHLLLHDFDNEHPFQYVNILSIAYKKRYPVPDLNLSFFLSYFTYFETKKKWQYVAHLPSKLTFFLLSLGEPWLMMHAYSYVHMSSDF